MGEGGGRPPTFWQTTEPTAIDGPEHDISEYSAKFYLNTTADVKS